MARNHYAVLGLGSFGAKLAVALARAGNTVLVVDIDQQRVDDLRDKVTEAIIADVSNEEVVRELNVRKFDAVISVRGSVWLQPLKSRKPPLRLPRY